MIRRELKKCHICTGRDSRFNTYSTLYLSKNEEIPKPSRLDQKDTELTSSDDLPAGIWDAFQQKKKIFTHQVVFSFLREYSTFLYNHFLPPSIHHFIIE